MTLRGAGWMGGLAVGLGAMALARAAGGELGGLAFLLGWLATGLLGELAALVLPAGSSPGRAGPRPPDRPADGVVEIVPVAGVRGEPNPAAPRLRRFAALEDPAGASAMAPGGPRGAGPLRGSVVVVSLFLGRDGRGWSDDEVARAYRAMEKAGTWIERQAIRWAAPVNLHLADTYFVAEDDAPREAVELVVLPEGDHEALYEAEAETKALAAASRAAARLGFADAAALIAEISRRVAADATVWLLHVRAAGQSIAIAADRAPWPGVGLAVCYAREANFPEPLVGPPFPDPVTFVHELLHLFGAEDKYGVPLHAFPRGAVTERDVMALHLTSLSRLRVDPRTAAEIGWAAEEAPKKHPPRPR